METAAAIVQAKQAVIFDLFHTLTALESTWGDGQPTTSEMLGVSGEAWNRQLLEQFTDRLVGRQRDPVAIIAQMARAIDPSIQDDRIRAAVANRVERFAAALINVPAQTCQVLQALRMRGKRLGLLSNADVMEVAAWQRSPLAPLFDVAVFSCEAGCAKPDRAIYDLCLRRLGVHPGRAVFIGDGGSSELQGARQVGMATILITGIIREIWPEKIPERAEQADAVMESLPELLAAVHGEGT